MNRLKKVVLTGTLVVSSLIGAGVVSAAPYTVSGNDTMWNISQHKGISLAALIKANPQVANPNVIWAGMTLIIPNSSVGNGSSTVTNHTAQSTFAIQVVSLVNQERAKAGLKLLSNDNALSAMALDKAKDMYTNNYFNHTSPKYGFPFDMMKSYGISFTYAGENIAKGQRTPQEVMNAWMNSPGHRQNIMSPNYAKIGTAYYNGEWVQEFT
ncbi:MAG: CAP domain-containing protein [Paenibacillaceae bacterium]